MTTVATIALSTVYFFTLFKITDTIISEYRSAHEKPTLSEILRAVAIALGWPVLAVWLVWEETK